jgi:S1-C subfamily serine protease
MAIDCLIFSSTQLKFLTVRVMRTKFMLALLLTLPFLSTLQAQGPEESRVEISKTTIADDGSRTTETLVKKGQAARDFNVDQYVKENQADNVELSVAKVTPDEERTVNVRGKKAVSSFEMDAAKSAAWLERQAEMVAKSAENIARGVETEYGRGYLGISAKDNDEDVKGSPVKVSKNKSAARAGLKSGDIITRLDDTDIDDFEDISDFMDETKPGQVVKVTFLRNGTSTTVDVTLGSNYDFTNYDMEWSNNSNKGFLGVSPKGNDDEIKGAPVDIIKNSAAEKAGMRNGDIIVRLDDVSIDDFDDIGDFMDNTAAGQAIKVTFQRKNETDLTVNVTLGREQSWDWNNNDFSNVSVRSKSACLGVYTDDSEIVEETNDNGRRTRIEIRGAQITDFTSNSAAKEKGLQKEDVIISIGGSDILGSDELWDEIAAYKPGDSVAVKYIRSGKTQSETVVLRACESDRKEVTIFSGDENGNGSERQFYTWNWGEQQDRNLRERRTITILKDAPSGDASAPQIQPEKARSLELRNFKAFPNPTQSSITIEFSAPEVPTAVSLFDMSGRELFREEMNAFPGNYNQQFDLTAYAKGTLVVRVQQGDKVFTEQVVVN